MLYALILTKIVKNEYVIFISICHSYVMTRLKI
nr:MAG TPA: hypothetical protein [Caudoviricetes sp.]